MVGGADLKEGGREGGREGERGVVLSSFTKDM